MPGGTTLSTERTLRFWRALAVCVGALPWTIVTFTLMVTGLAVGLGLAITLLGLPILAGTLHLARTLGEAERAALRWAAGAELRASWRPGPRSWTELRALLTDAGAWRDALILSVRMPVGIVVFTVAVVLVTVPLVYVTAPLTYGWAQIWTLTGDIESLGQALLAVPQGLVIAGLAAVSIPAMARLLAFGRSPGSPGSPGRPSNVLSP